MFRNVESRGGKSHTWLSRASILLLAGSSLVHAGLPDLDIDQPDSIKKVSSRVAYDLMSFYTGNRTGDVPGNLPQPYYWWEAGAMFGSLIDYWYYTGDDTYNDEVVQGMLHQMGPDKDFMTPNQTKTTGNDDQGFWGISAMSAAENKFPDPKGSDNPGWLELAQAVFNTQAARWDNEHCNGGLRWQVFAFNNGYDYKNTISNGCFFNLAARLALYTGNQTYADWAEKAYDWTAASGFMTDDYHFYDGAHTTLNCSDINKIQWTYNVGVYLYGAAAMHNFTSDDKWKGRTLGMLNGTSIFFKQGSDIMYEVACEGPGTCNTDNFSFKAYLARWMAATTKVAPYTHDLVMPKLRKSAQAAVKLCTGGDSGTKCPMKWYEQAFSGEPGVGQQMGVLETLQSNLIDTVAGPVTEKKGGTSKGNAAAGGDGSGGQKPLHENPIKTADRAGAGILTTLVLVWIIGGLWWMMI